MGVIDGTITSGGKPVAGIQIVSCEDWGMTSDWACQKPIQVRTDKHGKFMFAKITGFGPPATNNCAGAAVCAVADPGWSYWFRVIDGSVVKKFWAGGLGYGRLKASVDCELASPKNLGQVELDCSVIEVPLLLPLQK